MATTTIMAVHVNKGKTPRQCMEAQLNYIMNPAKTDGGVLISSHGCMPESAVNEFTLYRDQYLDSTGREIKNEVLAYHVRQAFKPGEITPEEANEIGKELAEKLTGNEFAYVVATHIDRHHVHNHIVICATPIDGQHKYRNVKRSGKDLANLSDMICREHQLSVIQNPQDKAMSYDKWQGDQKQFTKRDDLRMIIDAALRMQPDGFDALMQLLEDAGCLIKHTGQISIKPPYGERYIRLDTLGPEYDEATLRRALSGEHAHIPKIPRSDYNESQIKKLIDIEAKLCEGKGRGYQIWAERNNLTAMSQFVIFLKEHNIQSIDELDDQISKLQAVQAEKKSSIRQKQYRMKEINQQRQAIRDYGKTKDVYEQYKSSGWSVQFYKEHRDDIEKHKSAQAVYRTFDGNVPTLNELTEEYDTLRVQVDEEKAALAAMKTDLQDRRHIRHNYEVLARDIAPKSHQRSAPKDHHCNDRAAHHDDEAR